MPRVADPCRFHPDMNPKVTFANKNPDPDPHPTFETFGPGPAIRKKLDPDLTLEKQSGSGQ